MQACRAACPSAYPHSAVSVSTRPVRDSAAEFMEATVSIISGNYWLGSDGVRYHAPVLGMEGWDYAGLKSSVTTQRYGLQLNADVLGFFPSTRQSRWSVEVSPLLAAVGTKASLSTLDGGKEVCKENTEWHLGAGGNIQAGYRFACGIGVGISV